MAAHNERGKEGEALAAKWLEEHGYKILHRNWRHSYHEIDIIALRGAFLHFVEVKSSLYSSLGHPEERVTKKKFTSLKKAANEYLHVHPGHPWIQYDILAITLYKDREPEYFLLEDVYL